MTNSLPKILKIFADILIIIYRNSIMYAPSLYIFSFIYLTAEYEINGRIQLFSSRPPCCVAVSHRPGLMNVAGSSFCGNIRGLLLQSCAKYPGENATHNRHPCSQCQAGQVQCWVFLENYLPHFPSHFCRPSPPSTVLRRRVSPPHVSYFTLLQPCSGLAWSRHFIYYIRHYFCFVDIDPQELLFDSM